VFPHKIVDEIKTYTGRFIMYPGIALSGHAATVANATVAKHTAVHIPGRRKSRPLPL
jgi:hypothetical protein